MTKKEALDWLISRKEHYEIDDNCQELAEAIGIGIDAIEHEMKTGHCKDCNHFCELPHHTETLGRCTLHDLRFYPKGDWYCADFESRKVRIKNEAN